MQVIRRFITFGAALAALLFVTSSVVAARRPPRKVDTKAAAAKAAIGRPDLVKALRRDWKGMDGVCRTHVFPDDDWWYVPVRVTDFGVKRHAWIEVNAHSGTAKRSRINVCGDPTRVLSGCRIAPVQ